MTLEVSRRLSEDGVHWETVIVDEGAGGSGGVQLLGPFSVSFDDAGFLNPSNQGIETLAVPAGSLVLQLALICTETWIGSANLQQDQIAMALAASADGAGAFLGYWAPAVADTPSVALLGHHIIDASVSAGSAEALWVEGQNTPALAVADCHIYASYFPVSTDPTAGAFDLYALVVAT